MRMTYTVAAGLVLVASMTHAHESSEPPKASALGPVRGKTVQVTQAQIDLMMAAQPELRKMDEAATLQTRAEVRAVLLQRALLERGAIEAGLDKDPRVQLELRAARQMVLAKAYSRLVGDPLRVAENEVDTEYKRVVTDLTDVEYQMRRLVFVEKGKADDAIKALNEKKSFETIMRELAVPSGEEQPGEWRWISSQRMPRPVLDEIKRLSLNPTIEPQAVLVEGTWYVLQVQAQRPAQLPEKSQIQDEIRNKLSQSNIQSWLAQRRKAEGMDKTVETHTSKE